MAHVDVTSIPSYEYDAIYVLYVRTYVLQCSQCAAATAKCQVLVAAAVVVVVAVVAVAVVVVEWLCSTVVLHASKQDKGSTQVQAQAQLYANSLVFRLT